MGTSGQADITPYGRAVGETLTTTKIGLRETFHEPSLFDRPDFGPGILHGLAQVQSMQIDNLVTKVRLARRCDR